MVAGIKKYQPILADAKARGINESDTVFIIVEMLSEVFGYEKFSEITSEKKIRGTYCDLATVIDKKVQTLIEAKAIKQELKESHVKQAVDYATNQGVDWVVLTTGAIWQVYKVTYAKPIDHELILEIDFLALNHNEEADKKNLFLLTKESWPKSALTDYCDQKQALSKYSIGAVIVSDSVLNVIRHELRHISPDVKIDTDQIRSVLEKEVLNSDVIAGEKAEEARKRIARANNRALKSKADKDPANESPSTDLQEQVVSPTPIPPATTPIQPPN